MMNNRNKLLALVLAVQALIVFVVYTGGARQEQPAMALLGEFEAERVDKLVISDDQHNNVTLAKDEQGWYLARAEYSPGVDQHAKRYLATDQSVRYPVDQEKAKSLVTKLAGLRTDRLVTRTPSSHERLGVATEHFSRRLELFSGSAALQRFYLGVAPNYKTIHVRGGDDAEVYLIRDLALWEAPADAVTWWPQQYVEVAEQELAGIRLTNRHGSLALTKDEQGDWGLVGSAAEPAQEPVKELVDRARQMSMIDFLEPARAEKLGTPLASLTLETSRNQIEVTIWPKLKNGTEYPVKASNQTLHALVGGYEVEYLLGKKQGDFLGRAVVNKP